LTYSLFQPQLNLSDKWIPRIFMGLEGGWSVSLTASLPSVSRLYRKCVRPSGLHCRALHDAHLQQNGRPAPSRSLLAARCPNFWGRHAGGRHHKGYKMCIQICVQDIRGYLRSVFGLEGIEFLTVISFFGINFPLLSFQLPILFKKTRGGRRCRWQMNL
jgi:hypothetical protein